MHDQRPHAKRAARVWLEGKMQRERERERGVEGDTHFLVLLEGGVEEDKRLRDALSLGAHNLLHLTRKDPSNSTFQRPFYP